MRTEHDMLGEMPIDDGAYYGIHTVRAMQNFFITGVPIHAALVEALVMVKKAAAITNRSIGALDGRIADAIIAAATKSFQVCLRNSLLWTACRAERAPLQI